MKNRKETDDRIIITDNDYDDYIRLYNLKKDIVIMMMKS